MSLALAAIAIVGVITIFILYIELDDLSAISVQDISPEWVGKKFALGETIEILERPQFFPSIIDDVSEFVAQDVFTEEELPPEYRDLAAEQAKLENPPEQNVTISGNLQKSQVVATTDSHTKGDNKEAKLVTTNQVASIFSAGEIVPVVGKINVPNKNPPYDYGVTVYCCGEDKPMINKNNIGTDGQGNFLYKIITTQRDFPKGTYDVIVSTLSADIRSEIEYKWQFELR